MAAGKCNFDIEAGATVRKVFRFAGQGGSPIDFTGWKFRAQLRKSPSEDTAYDFECSYKNGVGEDTLPSDGIVTIYMSAIVSKTIECGDTITSRDSAYKWSLEKYVDAPYSDDPEVERVLEGDVRVSAEITKEVSPYV